MAQPARCVLRGASRLPQPDGAGNHASSRYGNRCSVMSLPRSQQLRVDDDRCPVALIFRARTAERYPLQSRLTKVGAAMASEPQQLRRVSGVQKRLNKEAEAHEHQAVGGQCLCGRCSQPPGLQDGGSLFDVSHIQIMALYLHEGAGGGDAGLRPTYQERGGQRTRNSKDEGAPKPPP